MPGNPRESLYVKDYTWAFLCLPMTGEAFSLVASLRLRSLQPLTRQTRLKHGRRAGHQVFLLARSRALASSEVVSMQEDILETFPQDTRATHWCATIHLYLGDLSTHILLIDLRYKV